MLTVISQELKPAAESKRKSRAKKKFDLTRLPTEILLTIFDRLDVFDSATLALTCKRLANIATIHSQLDMPMEGPQSYFWKPYEERHFLKKRLGDKFFSKRLRYCWGCKHYVPRREGHWKQKLGAKRFGNMLREHKSWDFEQWHKSPNTKLMLAQWNKGSAHKCPRCKLYKAFGLSPS
jgi:F-box-like